MHKIKLLLKKHKEIILYLFFGVMTTAINIISYNLCYYGFNIGNDSSNIISWLLSVIFAYITNKLWVFESRDFNLKTALKEIISFFGCRLLTGILDFIIMHIAVDILNFTPWIFKIISNIIVIILNYIASKFLIFIKKDSVIKNAD